ncbi:diaminopimelate epimerase [Rubrobacter marinus]|uniref:diaminopimelate epimerase n=1 Tax=Rubrobacter marinus TaxID=2653852 RepID=UPI001A9F7D0A|nr:diaminopimelate epimerase [Rubrobacter marinus]
MHFTKMHGAGNDFIILDPGEVEEVEDLGALARKVCDRHFGVGADGLLIPAPSDSADLKMVYLNSDGSPSEMCGNGLRCLARYARDYEILDGDALTMDTGAGAKKVILFEDGSSRVDMGPRPSGGRRAARLPLLARLDGQPARRRLPGQRGRGRRA